MSEEKTPIDLIKCNHIADVHALERAGREAFGEKVTEHLAKMAIYDPVYKYEREQDHFIKHAPNWEVQNWVEWNKLKRSTNKNLYGATETEKGGLGSMRDLGEVPYYLDHYMTAFDENFWKNVSKVRAFFKRNPLFCTAEAL